MTGAATEKLLIRSYNLGAGYTLTCLFDPTTNKVEHFWSPAAPDKKVAFDIGNRLTFEVRVDDALYRFTREIATLLGQPVGMLNPLAPEGEPIRVVLPDGVEAEASRTVQLPHGFAATFRIGSNAVTLEPTVSWSPWEPASIRRRRTNELTRAYDDALAAFLGDAGTDRCPFRDVDASRGPEEGNPTNEHE